MKLFLCSIEPTPYVYIPAFIAKPPRKIIKISLGPARWWVRRTSCTLNFLCFLMKHLIKWRKERKASLLLRSLLIPLPTTRPGACVWCVRESVVSLNLTTLQLNACVCCASAGLINPSQPLIQPAGRFLSFYCFFFTCWLMMILAYNSRLSCCSVSAVMLVG